MKAGFIAPRGSGPLRATPTLMQRIGGKNTQPERRRKNLKRYESRHKDPEPGIQNWVKTQGDSKLQSGQKGSDPEGQDKILPIPDKIIHEGFDPETPPEEMAKESRGNDQPVQCLVASMKSELI